MYGKEVVESLPKSKEIKVLFLDGVHIANTLRRKRLPVLFAKKRMSCFRKTVFRIFFLSSTSRIMIVE